MDDKERDDLFNSLFPIGGERWIKLKYLNQGKCIEKFRIGHNSKKSQEYAEENGYEVTAIGIRDEYTPQVSALMDVRDEVVTNLIHMFGDSEDYRITEIRNIFKDKIDEIKQYTIKHIPLDELNE